MLDNGCWASKLVFLDFSTPTTLMMVILLLPFSWITCCSHGLTPTMSFLASVKNSSVHFIVYFTASFFNMITSTVVLVSKSSPHCVG